MNKYQLIHIDTLESVMCEKYIVDGYDCYRKYDENALSSDLKYSPHVLENTIATTNTSLQCPQVVDYVEYLAELHSSLVWGSFVDIIDENSNDTRGYNSIKDYIDGYQKHSETHILSDEDVLEFNIWLVDNYFELGKGVWGDNPDFETANRFTTKELLVAFKQTLPIKVYYR